MAASLRSVTTLGHLGIGFAESSRHGLFLDEKGDIASTADELENFANGIWRRLMTPMGFYPEFPEYGSQLQTLRGMAFVPETISLAEIYVTQALVKDPRIAAIEHVRVTPNDYRAITIYASIRPVLMPNLHIMTFDYFLEG
jgi:phage baseplate assembly protein W